MVLFSCLCLALGAVVVEMKRALLGVAELCYVNRFLLTHQRVLVAAV